MNTILHLVGTQPDPWTGVRRCSEVIDIRHLGPRQCGNKTTTADGKCWRHQ